MAFRNNNNNNNKDIIGQKRVQHTKTQSFPKDSEHVEVKVKHRSVELVQSNPRAMVWNV